LSASRRSTVIVENLRKLHMRDQISNGKRLDGRIFNESRPLIIETNVIPKANGSAWVKLGNTEVVAGVKVETGEPFEGLENKGALIVSAEVLPTASPFVEPGPPDEETIELARVVDRGIRESEMLALDKLALIPGKIVYTVFVDCSIINTDGNLFDLPEQRLFRLFRFPPGRAGAKSLVVILCAGWAAVAARAIRAFIMKDLRAAGWLL